MRVIREASPKIANLWREGKIQPSVYRLMTYVIAVETDGGTLLHNAVTGELIFLDREETENVSSLSCAYAPWMDELIRKHFLVRADSDDKKTVDTLRFAYKLTGFSKDTTHYTVLTTTNCNARCFYCYEAGCRHEDMCDETADKLADFMEEHHGTKPVSIQWFGGEPLVGIRQIDRICKMLKARNIPFRSSMISNGYLFDEETVRRGKAEWNLQKVQITIDGTERIYNETKAYINPCENPFRRVMNNIGLLLANDISVVIRMNLGLHNCDDLLVLSKDLTKRLCNNEKVRFRTVILDNCGDNSQNFNDDELMFLYEKLLQIKEQLFGFEDIALPCLQAEHCIADNDSGVIVSPSGKLGKCEHYTGDHFIGNLDDGITDHAKAKEYAKRITFPQCTGCALYPYCVRPGICPEKQECSILKKKLLMHDALNAMKFHYEACL